MKKLGLLLGLLVLCILSGCNTGTGAAVNVGDQQQAAAYQLGWKDGYRKATADVTTGVVKSGSESKADDNSGGKYEKPPIVDYAE